MLFTGRVNTFFVEIFPRWVGMWGRRGLFVLYVWGVVGAGAWLLVRTAKSLNQDLVVELLFLLLLWLAAEGLGVPVSGGRLTATWALALASFFAGGMPAVLWLGGVATLVGHRLTCGESWRTTLFNAGQVILSFFLAFQIFRWVGGAERPLLSPHHFPAVLLFTLAYFTFNHLLVGFYCRWGRRSLSGPWREVLYWDALSYLFTLPVGYVMAVLWSRISFWLVPLVFLSVLAFQVLLRWCLACQQQYREFALLRRLTEGLKEKQSAEEACTYALELLQPVLPFRTGAVWVRWQEHGPFVWVAGVGPFCSLAQPIKFRPGEGFLGEAVALGEPVATSDAQSDPRLRQEEDFFRAERVALGFPLQAGEEAVGVLFLGGKSLLLLSPSSFSLLSLVADRLALTLAQFVWWRRWYRTTRSDSMLEEVWNRRFFLDYLREECRQAAEGNEPAALLLVDVDSLRSLNCHYGPLVGDAVLRELGRLIRRVVGSGSVVARYGGDCFAVWLRGAAEKVAWETAEKIRQEVEKRHFAVEGSFSPLRLRVSGAVAVFPADGGDFHTLLHKAEKALAEAKARGGNQVVAAAGIRGVKFFYQWE
ncbi:GGDEF domain-containing protein [Ammonifex thiophilus]|uniref:GGDEF domain-containing protein n=2 Tax=Ammonifex thiophilus TaxID=444093 RepID=A0A3D8P3E7_9THEO|nr:GGDEF domain-containing protein [Ammonifex thiophilus]